MSVRTPHTGLPESPPATAPAGRVTGAEYRRAAELLKRTCGIRMSEGKEMMLRARLAPRLQELGCPTLGAYLDRVEAGHEDGELSRMVDLLTTNKTGFLRERRHFDFLTENVFPALSRRAESPRFWSAGCSSGEEPYTLSIVCLEARLPGLADRPAILATDISQSMLGRARLGMFDDPSVEQLPRSLRERYLRRQTAAGQARWEVLPQVRANVRFATLNLIKPWPMSGPFDVIFFRNVAIYFERQTQLEIVTRMTGLLRPGGFLFIGHSEALGSPPPELAYVQPAIYRRSPTDVAPGDTSP